MDNKLTQRHSRNEELDNRQWLIPAVDIYENTEELLVVADLPGVNEDKIQLRLDKSDLTLEAVRDTVDCGEALGRECADFGFRRTFTLPTGIDSAAISAELSLGVLRVHLPKSEDLKPRRIAVKSR